MARRLHGGLPLRVAGAPCATLDARADARSARRHAQTEWRHVLRPRLAVLAVAVTLVAGCATTRIPVSGRSGFEGLDQKIGGRTGQVVLESGKVIHARNIHVYADSLCWTGRFTGEMGSGLWTDERASVPTADVKAIKIRRPARGALKGMLRGGGFGLALAIPTYLRSNDSYRSGYFVFLPALGGLIGIPFGIGADEDVYEFIRPAGTERASGERH